jgi:uncharacterized protein (TIGR02145 family)
MMSQLLLLLLIPLWLLGSSDDRALKKMFTEMKTEQRVALVIGNNDYKNLSTLKNPINDARAMKSVLTQRGFEVIYSENASKTQFKKMVKRFGTKISKGGVGLFYFAGHGIQVNGENYLVASDSNIADKDEVEFETIALDYVTKKMKNARNRFNVLILDACRNDPFSRSGGGGLAPLGNARGIFVAYATEAGSVAKDGSGSNGVFTKNLIRYMNEPLPIEQVFKRTRQAVYDETNHEQFPGVYNQSMGEFYFTLPDSAAPQSKAAGVPPPPAKSSFSFESVRPTDFSLTIHTDPKDATVQITNIDPKYYDGMRLKPGSYTIKVSKNGYYPKRGTIDLKNDLSIQINLEKQQVQQVTTTSNRKPSYTPSSNGTITHNGTTYGTVKSPYTGKVWLDRNLGAKRVCQSYNDKQCYGDYYQWGRAADGHEKAGSSSFKTRSGDWSSQSASSRQAFWMKTDGSGICPRGFRVPTIDELMAETVSQSFSNRNDAFNNFLLLPSAGYRGSYDGSMHSQGDDGDVWSSSPDGSNAKGLDFNSDDADADSYGRALGFSVRCLKGD